MDIAKLTSVKGTNRCYEQIFPLKPTGRFGRCTSTFSGSLEGWLAMDPFQPQHPATKNWGTHRGYKPVFHSKPSRGNCWSTAAFQAVAGGRLCTQKP